MGWAAPEAVGAGFARPFLAGWATLQEEAGDRLQWMAPGRGPRQRARELEERVRELELALAQAESALEENRELRTFLRLPPPPRWQWVAARVIARDAVTWNRRFRIGRGSQDGVVVGAAVLAPDGAVVGRVTECTVATAVVTTIADPTCRLSVVIGGARVAGVLRGRHRQKWAQAPECVVDFLPRQGEYGAGEPVRTSGLGADIPGGLPVGAVIEGETGVVATVVDAAYARLRIRPRADLANIRYAAVLVRRQPE